LAKLFDIRKNETKRVFLAFSMLLLVVGAITIVKAVRDALFLARFEVTQLSFIAVGLALVTSFVVSLYLKYATGVARNRLIGGTNSVVAASLAAIFFGLAMPALSAVLPWVLYIWSSIFGVFMVMQFWLLANDLFDAREAKRLFGVVGAGAIVGGLLGGVASRGLATVIGTRSLLLVAAAMLVVEAVLATMAWRERRTEEPRRKADKDQQPPRSGMRTLLDHRYVGLIALALLLSTVATTLLDWQFKGIVKAAYADRVDEMAGYFGMLYAILSGLSFVLQTFLTGWILRRFGVGTGLMLLPIAVLAGSGTIAGHGLIPSLSGLMAASSAKVAEGGMRFAIDKASVELLWMPVPPLIKESGKAFTDTVMDRLGTGITGLIWLALAGLGLAHPAKLHLISFAVLAVGVIWCYVVLKVRRAYVDAFREMLSQRELDLDSVRVQLRGAEAERTINSVLQSDDPRELAFAVHILRAFGGPLPDLSHLLAHPDGALVIQTLELLAEHQDERNRAAAIACLRSDSDGVRRAAIAYLRHGADRDENLLREIAAVAEDSKTQAALDIIRLGIPTEAEKSANELEQMLKNGERPERISTLRQLGAAPPTMAARLLGPALADDEPSVVDAALEAASSAKDIGLLPHLLPLLDSRRTRRGAMRALRALDASVVPSLVERLCSVGASFEAQLALIRVLGVSNSQEAITPLWELAQDSEALRSAALRALVRLRGAIQFELPRAEVDRLVRIEAMVATRQLLFLRAGSWASARQQGIPEGLLERTLREDSDQRVEHVFRLLSLRYSVDDLRAARRGLRSPLPSIRASSIEFLDNLLPLELKQPLLPLLEDYSAEAFATQASRSLGLRPESRDSLLGDLLERRYPLLQAVAAHVLAAEGVTAQLAKLERMAIAGPGGNPASGKVAVYAAWQREIFGRAIATLKGDGHHKTESVKMGLTAIEKALKLQTVDVLQRASTEDLTYVAQIAEEVEVSANETIYREGDAPDALYVVIDGQVRLHSDDVEIDLLQKGEAFGSWALVDEAPRVTAATAIADSALLKVDREEFLELLGDRVDIVPAIFKAIVGRLRALAAVAKAP
jgi:AAA family ATP:ADP antiporter